LRVADEPVLRVAFYAASPRDICRRTVLFRTRWLDQPTCDDAGYVVEMPPIAARTKYDRLLSKRLVSYVAVQYVLVIAATFSLLMWHHSIPKAALVLGAAAVLGALVAIGALLEGRQWAMGAELGRLALAGIAVAMFLTSGGCRRDKKPVTLQTIDGLAILASTVVDVVLLDVRMPKMTGLDVLAALAKRRAAPPCILLTTFDDDAGPLCVVRVGVRPANRPCRIDQEHRGNRDVVMLPPGPRFEVLAHAREHERCDAADVVDDVVGAVSGEVGIAQNGKIEAILLRGFRGVVRLVDTDRQERDPARLEFRGMRRKLVDLKVAGWTPPPSIKDERGRPTCADTLDGYRTPVGIRELGVGRRVAWDQAVAAVERSHLRCVHDGVGFLVR
jgi:CheY-like chemotaxis protein